MPHATAPGWPSREEGRTFLLLPGTAARAARTRSRGHGERGERSPASGTAGDWGCPTWDGSPSTSGWARGTQDRHGQHRKHQGLRRGQPHPRLRWGPGDRSRGLQPGIALGSYLRACKGECKQIWGEKGWF